MVESNTHAAPSLTLTNENSKADNLSMPLHKLQLKFQHFAYYSGQVFVDSKKKIFHYIFLNKSRNVAS